MVDVLWRGGRCEQAISLLCGYAMGSFLKGDGLTATSTLHSHVHES
jgi:hypothetical protein